MNRVKKNEHMKNSIMCTAQYVNKKLLPKKKGPLTRAQAEKAITKCHDPDCKMTEQDHELFYEGEIKTLMGKNGWSTAMSIDDTLDYLMNNKLFEVGEVTVDRYGNKTRHMIRKKQDCLCCGLRKGRSQTPHYKVGHKKDMTLGFLCKRCQNDLIEEYEENLIPRAKK